ncbi:MAG: hypothetical protein KAS98_07930, partial [Deltaproteobacteria bacterium]|nr:hypothetical protein [Deltaproteobacteria bacterium]
HHERFDGKGYPNGLSSNEIPLHAKIISVSETYDYLTSDLSYRNAFPKDKAFEELKNASGTQLDPEIVRAFLDSVH